MSKPLRLFSILRRAVFLSPLFGLVAYGQLRHAEIRVDEAKLPSVTIVARVEKAKNLFFLRSIAGVDHIGDRATIFDLRNTTDGSAVPFRRLAEGEYVADSDFDTVNYRVELTPVQPRGSSAHVSWFAKDVGILMGADMLPNLSSRQNSSRAVISFGNWGGSVFSSEKLDSYGRFTSDDPANAVFYFGNGWRAQKLLADPRSPTRLISGQWNFTDAHADQMISEIFLGYEELFKGGPADAQIAIARFPVSTDPGAWEAETRGKSVTIISSDMPFKTQSLQRLHEQLRHELFHLWIPNGVNLTGNYDWFYEGFALYESLKLAVRMNRIGFADFLDTLSRAHTIDSAQSQRISLIQASANRFGGSNTQVYARGMLVAFLTDLAVLEKSKGKKSVEDLLRELYRTHGKSAPPAEGNAAVIDILKTQANENSVVEKYITGVEKIEWTKELSATGIEDSDPGPLTTLRVKEKLNGGQKAMLDKLGYNNWRKLSDSSK